MQADDRVLLIDLENMVGLVQPRPDLVRARVHALLEAAGPVHHALASYAQGEPSSDRGASVLAELRVAPWPVPAGKNAADDALLQHARYVHSRGGRTFTVASADHRFAELARWGQLDVLAWEGQPVARALTAAGAHLRRLPRASTSGPAAPAAHVAAVSVSRARATPSRPVEMSLRRGLLSAILTGVGIGIGERLTARALRTGVRAPRAADIRVRDEAPRRRR
ncbi:hypothetical protein [Frankia sp. AgKG'84/4]|uniref:hypothetical protein n=1 Tax=Frankia sp. AgKG'84/4 TaxID=573490 RepID=UPI002010350C|nr:hypothetical protein [Frankia sp. AgKG'84/4]MCL9793278.1 hypothetical protein [Frankia sp. AgKG'84/4]